ncbi:MAG: hypothetical protein GY752_09800 [bacterium]|nr:hypothetical protein [bacterium]MCP4800033.1 hypothetical protein [bacterium]
MVRNTVIISLCLFVLVPAVTFSAEEEQTFNLKHTTAEEQQSKADAEALENYWEPLMPSKTWEASVTLGFMSSSDLLLDQNSIIYKYTDAATYFGDVQIDYDNVFSPALHLAYDLYPWFSVEGILGIGISEYNSHITNAFSVSNDEDQEMEDVEVIGEFDPERRSYLNVFTGVNAMFYPPDYGNFGRGRWHPYLIGGIGRNYITINSNYTDDIAANWSGSAGAGIRFIADSLVSIRFDMMYHVSQVDFGVKNSFASFDEGTEVIPVYEFTDGQHLVTEYDKQTVSSIGWAIGFYADF